MTSLNLSGSKNTDQRQNAKLAAYKKHDHTMKWITSVACVAVVLLLLLLGYATDWTRGLKSSSGSGTPLSSNLDSLRTVNGDASTATKTGTGGTSSTTGTNSTDRSSTTTTNNSTTTNNTTADSSSTLPNDLLSSLFDTSSTGESLNTVLQNAQSLGVAHDCHADPLVQVCNFSAGDNGQSVTVKSLLGTGLVTSVTKNF